MQLFCFEAKCNIEENILLNFQSKIYLQIEILHKFIVSCQGIIVEFYASYQKAVFKKNPSKFNFTEITAL